MLMKFLRDESGAVNIEYVLLASVAATVFILAGIRFQNEIVASFNGLIRLLQRARGPWG